MKTKYIFASLLLSSFAFTGCEDMDTLPEGNIVTSNQKDEIGKIDPTKVEARVNAIFAQFSLMTPNKGALQLERHNDFGYPSVMLFTDVNGNDVVSDDNGYNWMTGELDYTTVPRHHSNVRLYGMICMLLFMQPIMLPRRLILLHRMQLNNTSCHRD